MPVIDISTVIAAPIERCFDLSRSIDLHLESMSHTNERAVAGVVSAHGISLFGCWFFMVAWLAVMLTFR